MARRHKSNPWNVAGRRSDQLSTGDEVVRDTGWVFNNETGESLTLAQFVDTGDHEVPAYLERFGLRDVAGDDRTVVEIGSGIGRMTASFSREFGSVYACDLDSGFLERCRETVGKFGRVDHLQTVHVADGHSLDIPDDVADLTFSYITLQHCTVDDALGLVDEALRVTKPGGRIALNFRGPASSDFVVLPVGAIVRGATKLPVIGSGLSHRRALTRLAWQVSRIHPDQVLGPISNRITDPVVWTNPTSKLTGNDPAERKTFEGINPNHWWVIATVV